MPDKTLEFVKITKLRLQFEKGNIIIPGQTLDEMIPTIDVENEGMSDLDSSDSASNDENITANSFMREKITKSALKVSKSLSYINYRKKRAKSHTSSESFDSEFEPESKRV